MHALNTVRVCPYATTAYFVRLLKRSTNRRDSLFVFVYLRVCVQDCARAHAIVRSSCPELSCGAAAGTYTGLFVVETQPAQANANQLIERKSACSLCACVHLCECVLLRASHSTHLQISILSFQPITLIRSREQRVGPSVKFLSKRWS